MRHGFTIVELLIVIVVIGILAGISTAAYGAVQAKAFDARRAAGIAEYIKLLKMYKQENGSYPSAVVACLGNKSDYPATSRWSYGACMGNDVGSYIYSIYKVEDSVNDALRSYTNSALPNSNYGEFQQGVQVFRGPMYQYINDTLSVITFYASNKGSVTCQSLGDGQSYLSVSGDLAYCQIYLSS